ncbi:LamG domain-containing protein [Metabacillus fastidiosus]|uniref:LamG domain-containing protein n=1 Tax=Metabacillus fastidiosus TaxID=1458 RepID=UPI003D2BB77B
MYLAFDNNINDNSGNGNNGTLLNLGNISYVTGKVGNAIQFKGTDAPAQVKIANNSTIQFNDKLTVAYWLRIDNSKGQEGNYGHHVDPGIQSVFAKDSDNTGLFNILYMNSSTSGNLGFHNTSSVSVSITKSQWIHLSFVIDHNKIRKYVNGELAEEKTIPPANFTISNTKDLYIGYQGNGWYPLYGTLDDFRMYKRALTDIDILGLYTLGS